MTHVVELLVQDVMGLDDEGRVPGVVVAGAPKVVGQDRGFLRIYKMMKN